MKKLFTFLLFALFANLSFAQDKIVYDNQAQKREVTGFHAVRVSHGIELLLKQGDTEALAISATTNEQRDAVITEVVEGELRIYIRQNLEKWWNQLRKNGVKVKAYLSFKNLERIDASSGSKASIDGRLSGTSLSVDLSSGGFLGGELKVNKLDIELSSGARSSISGTAGDLDVESSSGAHFSGYGLETEKGKADASSGGKIELSVNKEIAASASSGGAVYYKGPGAASISTSTGGKVKKTS